MNLDGFEILEDLGGGPIFRLFRGVSPQGERVLIKKGGRDATNKTAVAHLHREYEVSRELGIAGVLVPASLLDFLDHSILVFPDEGFAPLDKILLRGPLELCRALQIAAGLAATLAELHKQGYIHRYIQPGNILVAPDGGAIRLHGLGIATRIPNSSQGVKGTVRLGISPTYISPELSGRINRLVDYRTDLYSLGVTLFEMVTGLPPFTSTDPLELIHAHVARQPPAANLDRPEVPEPVAAIVRKLLAKSAEDRYQGGRGLKLDLERCSSALERGAALAPFPLAETDPPSRFELPQRFYGRDAELGTLLDAFAGTSQGRLRVLMVSGEPGIGKTSLVQELRKAVFEKNGLFLTGKYDALERATPYLGIRAALQGLWQKLLIAEPEQLASYRSQLRKLLGANAGVIVDLTPEFGKIIGEVPQITELEPQESKNRFKLCLHQVLRGLAQKNRPIVLFLDDLQWADLSSLELIEGALDKELKNLLLIGTYRDNEVSERHPLVQSCNRLEEKGIPIDYLFLGPLEMPDIRSLVADSLRIGVELAAPLADQIFRKTAGNPFFTRAVLVTVYEEGHLYLDQQGTWSWDLEKIAELESAGNVYSLAARAILRIPEGSRGTVSTAAALGHPIEVKTLAAVCESSEAQTEAHLIEACRERILVESDGVYLFRHDQLKESAYELIPAADQPALHLRIGRFLAQRRAAGRETSIFAVVDHLNRAKDLLESRQERFQVAQTNLEAGQAAKAAAAFPAAYQYFSFALTLIPGDAWSRHYPLVLALHNEAAETAYLTSDFREADRLVGLILANAHSVIDKISAYETQIALANARLLETEAIRITLEVVQLLGVNIPDAPTPLEVDRAVNDISAVIVSAIDAPDEMPTQRTRLADLAAMRLLARAAVVVGMMNHPLYILMTNRLLGLAIRYPRSAEAPVAYIMAGGIMCYLRGDYHTGCQAGDRGIQLLSLATSRRWEPFCRFIFSIDINCWRKHYHDLVDEIYHAYRIGREAGDLLTASMSSYYACEAALLAGTDLNQLKPTIRGLREEALQVGAKRVSAGLFHLEEVAGALVNGIEPVALPPGEELFRDLSSDEWQKSADQTIQEINFCHQIMLLCFYRQRSGALQLARRTDGFPIGGVTGFLPTDYFICLAILDSLRQVDDLEQERLWEILAVQQRKVQLKSQACPANYRQKLRLVEAQQYRILGNTVKAMEFFDLAIEEARRHRYTHDEALACEIAAEFYLDQHREMIAQTYLRAAESAYAKWGAWGKLDQLHSQYPGLLSQRSELPERKSALGQLSRPASEEGPELLDIASIERAAAALSRELDLPRLLKMLIDILLQNAGAQRGLLLREEAGKIVIEASGSLDDASFQILERTPIDRSDKLSRSIVRYVSRSRETVVIGDASKDERFSGTPYVGREKPKSILCAPILHRGRPVGIIYLENNLIRDAFTAERLKAIQLISSQAAVALENAHLLEGLKQEVRIRKQAEDELRKALAEVDQLKERLYAENVYLKEEILGSHGFDEIVGKGEALRKMLAKVSQVSSTNATVLILGETGTGKELIARAIHNRSPRKESPMVRVNCAALPATLIESELFGHEKGAFTGALARKLGRFELADGGTIFLDEIGELPLELQAKLLRIIQEGEFERLGSAITQKVDVRVIAATNRDLQQEVLEGRFRSDLFYRLNVFPMELPPLRERREDIPLLVWYFISKKQAGAGKTITKIPREVLDALTAYRWPGNIRELENVVERAVILSRGGTLSLDDSLGASRAPKEREPVAHNLDDVERNHIVYVLGKCGWRVKGKGNAAEQLGLNSSTLLFRMKKLGIRRPEAG